MFLVKSALLECDSPNSPTLSFLSPPVLITPMPQGVREAPTNLKLYAGFDGGGTKTRCVLARADGTIVGTGSAGPSNYHNVGLDNALGALRSSFELALAKAGIGKENRATAACFGLAALDSRKDMETMNQAANSMGLALENLVVNDWRITLSGAFVDEPGVILIAGTGSVAAGQNAKSETVRVGGWGSIIDDRGSAYDIGKEALYAALRAYDGRGPRTKLLSLLMKRLNANEPQDLVEKVYLRSMGVAGIASLCTVVGSAALAGDAVSRSILSEKAKDLGELAVTAAARLGMLREPFRVSMSGGVFSIGRPLLGPLKTTIRASAPRAKMVALRLPPVCGAIVFLLQREGRAVDSSTVQRLSSIVKAGYQE